MTYRMLVTVKDRRFMSVITLGPSFDGELSLLDGEINKLLGKRRYTNEDTLKEKIINPSLRGKNIPIHSVDIEYI